MPNQLYSGIPLYGWNNEKRVALRSSGDNTSQLTKRNPVIGCVKQSLRVRIACNANQGGNLGR